MTTAMALPDLADRINAAHRECAAAMNQGLQHALEAGRLLLEAKEQCTHGEWTPWLETNFAGSTRTARAYMQVAKRWPELEAKRQTSAILTIDGALTLLGPPQEEQGSNGDHLRREDLPVFYQDLLDEGLNMEDVKSLMDTEERICGRTGEIRELRLKGGRMLLEARTKLRQHSLDFYKWCSAHGFDRKDVDESIRVAERR